MTHVRFGWSHLDPTGQQTQSSSWRYRWTDQFRFLRGGYLHPPRPFISVFHTTLLFHPFSSFHTSSNSFLRTFSSVIWLRGTCWVFIFVIHWIFRSPHSFNVTLFPKVWVLLQKNKKKEKTRERNVTLKLWGTVKSVKLKVKHTSCVVLLIINR